MREGKKCGGMSDREVETGRPEKGGAALTAEPDGMEFGFRSSGKQQRVRGFIVVAVLWILAALSALVLIYLTYVTNTAVVVAGSTARVQTEALVTAGLELAVYQLTAVNEEQRPTSGTFDANVGAGSVTVTFRSE